MKRPSTRPRWLRPWRDPATGIWFCWRGGKIVVYDPKRMERAA